jgi:hypothetical protein
MPMLRNQGPVGPSLCAALVRSAQDDNGFGAYEEE